MPLFTRLHFKLPQLGIACASSLALLLTGCYAVTSPSTQGVYAHSPQPSAVEDANIRSHTVTTNPTGAPKPDTPHTATATPAHGISHTTATAPGQKQQGLFLQAGSFLNESGAQAVMSHIQSKAPALAPFTRVALRGDMYRVLIGPFANEQQRQLAATMLRSQAQTNAIRITP